ncbi:Hypothetical predicted protein [Paramuricea clavata]|uniref:Uncharacterized protein n=1 Tax=Paramuricea clavata TaxID=317549 RepID=A0A7D9HQR3_PARCT|nr:Hypothetical predicted protein [Paramuricea clavata]
MEVGNRSTYNTPHCFVTMLFVLWTPIPNESIQLNFHFAFELSEEHTLRQLCLAKRSEHWLRIENLQEKLGKQSSSLYVEVPVAASCCHLHQEDSLVCRSDVVGEDL